MTSLRTHAHCLSSIQAFNDQVTLGDAFSYQAMNARSAKVSIYSFEAYLCTSPDTTIYIPGHVDQS